MSRDESVAKVVLTLEQAERKRLGTRATSLGIAVSVFFCVVKVAVGYFTGALSLIADGFHNLSDAASSLVTLLGFYFASRPADPEHPFGHGRVEYLSGLGVAVGILLVGLELLKTSVLKILHPEPLVVSALVLGVPAASLVAQFLLARHYTDVANRINSAALHAAALDCKADCWSTVAVLASLLVYALFGLDLDGLAGLIVALCILASGYHAAKSTITPLLGEPPDPALVEGIKRLTLSTEHIVGIHDLIIHTYGPGRHFASLHAEVLDDGKLSLMQLHVIIDGLEQAISRQFNIAVTVHLDPLANDEDTRHMRKFVGQLVNALDERLSMHDFRMVHAAAGGHNLLFDVVVPYTLKMSDEQIARTIQKDVNATYPQDKTIIHFDRQYC